MDPRITSAEFEQRSGRPIDREALQSYVDGRGTLMAALDVDARELHDMRCRGLALLDAGRAADARAVFDALLALGDDDPGVRFSLAQACAAEGNLEVAIEHFEHALHRTHAPRFSEMRAAALTWAKTLVETVAS